MKTVLYSITALLISAVSTAQTAVLKGNVKAESSQNVSAATVNLLAAKDSTLYKAGATDNAGSFQFERLHAGQYLVKITGLNYKPYFSSVFELKEGETFTMPLANLVTTEKKLKDVVVTASKKPMIEVKADRTVVNVENSINSTGNNAMELLQKSPGITVDKDDNISMKSKNGVIIYIDGKPSPLAGADLAAYLRSVQSTDIESIELVENPSAKYDAAGNAGIINIKFKKNKKFGTNGNASVGYNKGINNYYNGSLGLNYRNKKFNLFSNLSAGKATWSNYQTFTRVQNDSLYDQHNESKSPNKYTGLKLGADYSLSNKSTIGVMFSGNYGKNEWDNESQTIISGKDNKTPSQILKASNGIPGNRSNSNINLNYRYADTSGTELNIDVDRGIFRGRGSSYQPNAYYDAVTGNLIRERIFSNNTPTNIDIYTAKVDYEQKLFKGKIGAGAKYASVKTDNTFEFFNVINNDKIQDWERSNKFTYTENVAAAYLNYNRQFKKFSLQAGLRAEQTKSEGVLNAKSKQTMKDTTEVINRSYLNFFPSAAVSYNMSEKHQFNLNYSRRIDRPRYQNLNPFEFKLDELTYQKGNAFLRPQYTNSFSLSHTYKSILTTSLSYSHVMDFSTQIVDTTRKNASFVTEKNLAKQDVYSVNMSAPIKVSKWWNIFANATASQTRLKASFEDGKAIDEKITSFNFYNQHTFTVGHGFTVEASGWYNSPSIWGGTFKTSSQWAADLGVQKTLLDKKATLKVSLTDVFKTNSWNSVSTFAGMNLTAKGGWDSRQLRVSFSYRFGNNQVKAARERKSGLESESNRL